MINPVIPPPPIRAINTLGRLLSGLGVRLPSLAPDRLERAAAQRTGLDDFGSPDYREGLERLCESLENEAGLTTLGRLIFAETIGRALCNRLLHVRHMASGPLAELRPPLVILGLPRSGTTFLHRAMSEVQEARALEAWELNHPYPPMKGTDDRFSQVEASLAKMHALAPMLDAKHYIRAGLPEECRMLLDPSFRSLSFALMAPTTSYLQWFLKQDMQGPYKLWAEQLASFQAQTPNKRLTLKAPTHAGNLVALRAAAPGAMLVQTHREPKSVTGSTCSLLHTFYGMTTTRVDSVSLGKTWLETLGCYTDNNLLQRQQVEVYDVYFDELMADPLGTIRAIHAHYDLEFGAQDEARITQWIARRPRNKHGVHHYQLDDFGLTPDEVDARFSDYYDAHPKLQNLRPATATGVAS